MIIAMPFAVSPVLFMRHLAAGGVASNESRPVLSPVKLLVPEMALANDDVRDLIDQFLDPFLHIAHPLNKNEGARFAPCSNPNR